MTRSPQEVGETHLAAVVSGDPVAMAADYATNAVLQRGGETFRGHDQIAAYFAGVPDRLGTASVVFDSIAILALIIFANGNWPAIQIGAGDGSTLGTEELMATFTSAGSSQ